jgi:hypothetical protein
VLTKVVSPSAIADYDRPALFRVDAGRLEGVEDLHELLERLAGDWNTCVIRGALKSESAGRTFVLRRCRDRGGAAAPFAPAPRSWLMVEADSLPCPAGLETDPLVAGGIVRGALPAPFRSARAVAQLSSTAGIKPGIRAHLWFWLDRPVSDHEAKRWLGAAPVDPSVYTPVQPHYTASPIFEGLDDPCHERLAILPGHPEVAVPDLTEPVRPTWRVRRSSGPLSRGLAGIGRTQAIMRIRADITALTNAPPGRRHPTRVEAMARARFYARRHRLPWPDIAGAFSHAFAASLAPHEHHRAQEAGSMADWLEERDP